MRIDHGQWLAGKESFSVTKRFFRIRGGGKVKKWVPANANRLDAKYTRATTTKPPGLMVWQQSTAKAKYA